MPGSGGDADADAKAEAPPPPPSIAYCDEVSKGSVAALSRLNLRTLPIPLQDSLYKKIRKNTHGCYHVRLARTRKGTVVGGVAWVSTSKAAAAPLADAPSTSSKRPASLVFPAEAKAQQQQQRQQQHQFLYVLSLGVLTPYRRQGIASQLLRQVLDYALSLEGDPVAECSLHVVEDNEEALAFYRRHGFSRTSRVDNYYCRHDPPHAMLCTRVFPRRPPAQMLAVQFQHSYQEQQQEQEPPEAEHVAKKAKAC
jgi:ribosomal protein S18 acetylase RimI-like enzyme